jgi:membrane-bound lytic murein transglycosylase B
MLQNPPPEDAPALSRNTVLELQSALSERGYDAGKPDGITGPATRSAIRKFQHDKGMIADGFPGQELLDRLEIDN